MSAVSPPIPLLKMSEVAERLHISPATAYRLAANGKLPAIRVGGSWRVDAARLERWLEERAS